MRVKASSVEDGRAEHSKRVKGESERAKRGRQAFGARFGDVTWSNCAFLFLSPRDRGGADSGRPSYKVNLTTCFKQRAPLGHGVGSRAPHEHNSLRKSNLITPEGEWDKMVSLPGGTCSSHLMGAANDRRLERYVR